MGFLLRLAAGCASIGVELVLQDGACFGKFLLVPFLGFGVWRRVRSSLGFPELTEHCMVWSRFS
jgi:hypothetical protein